MQLPESMQFLESTLPTVVMLLLALKLIKAGILTTVVNPVLSFRVSRWKEWAQCASSAQRGMLTGMMEQQQNQVIYGLLIVGNQSSALFWQLQSWGVAPSFFKNGVRFCDLDESKCIRTVHVPRKCLLCEAFWWCVYIASVVAFAAGFVALFLFQIGEVLAFAILFILLAVFSYSISDRCFGPVRAAKFIAYRASQKDFENGGLPVLFNKKEWFKLSDESEDFVFTVQRHGPEPSNQS